MRIVKYNYQYSTLTMTPIFTAFMFVLLRQSSDSSTFANSLITPNETGRSL